MIVVMGSVNMDLVVNVAEIPKVGETVTGGVFSQNPGGKGANQAVAAAKLGSAVQFVGAVGDDGFGVELKDTLARNGVGVDSVETLPVTASGIALIQVDCHGRNNISVASGANFAITKEQIDRHRCVFEQATIAIFQLETPLDVTVYAMDVAKESGCTVILNPAPAMTLSPAMLRSCDILIPNEHELSGIANLPAQTESEIQVACDALRPFGVGTIITTMGAKGVYYSHSDRSGFIPANKVDAVDTTAAGDAFIGGFAHALEQGNSIADAITIGQKVAAYAVCRHGAQQSMPSLQDLK